MFSCLLPGGPAGRGALPPQQVRTAQAASPVCSGARDRRNVELPAWQVTAEQEKGPHVPVHPGSSSQGPGWPHLCTCPAQVLGSILFPFHVLAGLVFHGVTAPVSLPPHALFLISAPVAGVLPTDPSCTPASSRTSLHRSVLQWTSWGWGLPIFWCKESETSYCKTIGEIFDMLPASELWSLNTWLSPLHLIHKNILINVRCKPINLANHCLSLAPASSPSIVAQCRNRVLLRSLPLHYPRTTASDETRNHLQYIL